MDRWKSFFVLLLAAPPVGLHAQPPGMSLQLIGEALATASATPQKVVVDAGGKPYYYLAAKTAGLQVYDIQDIAHPQLAATVPVSQLNGLEVMNAVQRGNLLYLAVGNFFGNDGQNPGLAILDVSSPASPAVKDVWMWPMKDKGSASVALSGDYAYLCAMTQGVLILNVADPSAIQFISQIVPDPNFPVPNPPAVHIPNARGMAVRDDVAYLCYDAGGLRVINVADKLHPVETGRYANAVMGDKPIAFNNVALDGDLAFVAADYCGMEVLNISDTSHITQTSWWNPWNCQSPTNIWVGSPGHTNQIDLDTAGRLAFLSSAQSELSILDISDPALPKQAGNYGATNDQLGTWGMTLDSNRVFLAYITSVIPFASTWAGVKILEWEKTTGIGETACPFPANMYPNPFWEWVNVEFSLERKSELQIQIFDLQGNQVENMARGVFEAGKHSLAAGISLPAGMYLLRINAPEGAISRKLVKF